MIVFERAPRNDVLIWITCVPIFSWAYFLFCFFFYLENIAYHLCHLYYLVRYSHFKYMYTIVYVCTYIPYRIYTYGLAQKSGYTSITLKRVKMVEGFLLEFFWRVESVILEGFASLTLKRAKSQMEWEGSRYIIGWHFSTQIQLFFVFPNRREKVRVYPHNSQMTKCYEIITESTKNATNLILTHYEMRFLSM